VHFFFFSGFGGGSVMEVLLVSKMEKKTNGLASVEDTFYFSLGEKESFFIRSGQAIFVRVFSK
jgi:hypothetical protein